MLCICPLFSPSASTQEQLCNCYCMILFANMVNYVQPHLTCIYIAVCFHSECLLSDMCLCCTGLTMHATILAFMFSLVEEDKIGAPLYNAATIQASSNALYIQQYVADLIKQAYPHLQEWVGRCCACFLCVFDSVSWWTIYIYMYLVFESHPNQFKNDFGWLAWCHPTCLGWREQTWFFCVYLYVHCSYGCEDQTLSTQPILLPLRATHPHPPRYNTNTYAMQHNIPLVHRSELLLWLCTPAPPIWLTVFVVYAVLKWKYL